LGWSVTAPKPKIDGAETTAAVRPDRWPDLPAYSHCGAINGVAATPSSPHGVPPPAPATWDFFLSHAGCDSAITACLDEALIRLGCKSWFDKRCLVDGDPWSRVLPAMMAASKIVVVLVSSATRDAYYQDSEIGRAIDLVRAFPGRYRVIAVLIDMHAPIARIELPFGLERTTLLSWAECGNVDAVALQLVDALEGAAPRPTIAAMPVDATAAFVGETAWGSLRPVVLTRWSEFESAFGPPLAADQSFLAPAVKGFFDNGGQRAYVARALGRDATFASVAIPTADPMQQLIVQARYPGALGNQLAVMFVAGARRGVRARLSIDQGQRIVEDRDNLSIEDEGANSLLRGFNGQSAWVGLRWSAVDRPAAMPVAGDWILACGTDGVVSADDLLGSALGTGSSTQATGLVALEQVPEAALLSLPDAVHPRFSGEDQARLTRALVALAERRLAVALVALPRSAQDGLCPQAPGESSHAFAVAPWVTIREAAAAGRSEAHSGSVAVPAVGHVAGLLARHDTAQGLHRSPSGAELLGLCGSGLDPASTGPWTVDDGVRRGVNFIHP
jgi:TIR domain